MKSGIPKISVNQFFDSRHSPGFPPNDRPIIELLGYGNRSYDREAFKFSLGIKKEVVAAVNWNAPELLPPLPEPFGD